MKNLYPTKSYTVEVDFSFRPMQLLEQEKLWQIAVEEKDNQLGLINIIRYLDSLQTKISEEAIDELMLEINLENLLSVTSELIAQFVMLQTSLVRFNGRLRIVEASMDLKSSFDVVMLDKIIPIQYAGQSDGADSEEE